MFTYGYAITRHGRQMQRSIALIIQGAMVQSCDRLEVGINTGNIGVDRVDLSKITIRFIGTLKLNSIRHSKTTLDIKYLKEAYLNRQMF